MRFYLKLLLAVMISVAVMRPWFRQVAADIAFDMRVAWVCARGDASEFERLVDDTQRRLATQRGELELYLWNKRSRELLAERVAQAAREHVSLTEGDLELLRIQCGLETLGDPRRLPAAAGWAQQMAEFEAQLLRERRRIPPTVSSASAPTLAGSGSEVSDSSYAPPKIAASSGVKIPS